MFEQFARRQVDSSRKTQTLHDVLGTNPALALFSRFFPDSACDETGKKLSFHPSFQNQPKKEAPPRGKRPSRRSFQLSPRHLASWPSHPPIPINRWRRGPELCMCFVRKVHLSRLDTGNLNFSFLHFNFFIFFKFFFCLLFFRPIHIGLVNFLLRKEKEKKKAKRRVRGLVA